MQDNTEQSTPSILVRLDTKEITAVPGRSTTVSLTVANQESSADFFEISVRGIPTAWVSISTPVIRLSPGEEGVVRLTILPPPPEQIQSGRFSMIVRVASQENPQNQVEVEAALVVAAFVVEGRIGILMESVQFSVSPGSSASLPIVIHNQGLVEDSFRLSVDGIPAGWVSTSMPVVQISPGEQKEATLSIRPPRSPQSRAGRHTFQVKVTSQQMPDQTASVNCTLTVAAYSQFNCKLEPQRVNAGKPARVVLANQGNIQGSYRLTWQSHEDVLAFEPGSMQEVRVPAGETGVAEFTVKPSRSQILGGEVSNPYRVVVGSSEKEMQTLNGEVLSRGLIPVWVLPVVLLVCVGLICVSWLFMGWIRPQEGRATQTAMISGTQVAAATQTAAFNMTAAAIEGEQDSDGDGLTNREEGQLGTDPFNPDTDGDELTDGNEVKNLGTDPLNQDTDKDRLSDGEEVLRQGTDPKNSDTDADRLSDGDEVLDHRTDPKKPDTDGDALNDGDEIDRKTNPLKPDTDEDELNDGAEVQLGTNPLNPDTDNDRLKDGVEGKNGRDCPDPLNPDSDGDGIVDGLDLDPCDPTNPSMTATAAAGAPTATLPGPTAVVPSPTVPAPALPGLFLWESNRDGNPEIYRGNPSSGEIVRLTISPGSDTQPAWSPDRNRIAFVSSRDGNNEIYLMNQDGTAQVNLTNSPSDDQYPSWSPDGQWIAFASNRDGNQEVYRVRPDGSDLQNMTANSANDFDPSWLFGDRITFTSTRDGNQEIYIMNSDGSGQTNLTNNSANDYFPSTLPDGDRIVFTSDRDGNQDIYVMNASGRGVSRLTNNPSQDLYPAWSADSAWIAFTTNRDGNWEVYVMRPDGAQPYNYTQNPATDTTQAWR